jgi:hypothetical protein
MDAADTIRHSLADVTALRAQQQADPPLAQAVLAVKQWQSRRFAGTYADLMGDPLYQGATRFFLEELYSPGDYSERDTQFGRIAGTLQTVFPQAVVQTATDLALLHMQTERLDHAMALAWVHLPATPADAARYVAAWRGVGERAERERQLASVMQLGQDLTRFTRMPGLRTMLRMMRKPAQAAGLGALQHFLETGFDTFGQMARRRGAVEHFLATVHAREAALMQALFDGDPVACGTQLEATLGVAR